METKLTKLKSFKQATLTEEERNLMRAHAARIVIASPVIITESFFKRGVQHGLRIALSSMLFIVFIAGSVSAVASNALPGDPLYPFKVNVNEEIKGALTGNDPARKALNDENLVENRVGEIQTLAESNSLTKAKQEIAEKALNSNVQNLSASLNTLSAQAPTTALTVTASLEQTLQANKTAIENTPNTPTTDNAGKAAALQNVNATLQTVSNQEVQIISKEINDINDEVTATTQTSAVSTPVVTTTVTDTQTATVASPAVTPVAP